MMPTALTTRQRHARHILTNLGEILGQQQQQQQQQRQQQHQLLDLTVVCRDGKIVPASRLLLASASPSLAKAMRETDDDSSVLLLPDLPSSDLENFLSCLMSPFSSSSSSSSGGGFALHRGSISRACRCLMMAYPIPEEEEDVEEEEEATREIVIDIDDVSTVNGDEDGGNLGEVEEEEEEEEDDNDSLDGGQESSGSPPVTLQRFGPLVCPLCRRRYNHTKARNRHLLSEHGRECLSLGWRHPCPRCPMAFVSREGRERHLQRAHHRHMKRGNNAEKKVPDGEVDFRCLFCPSTSLFSDLRSLRDHVRSDHPDRDRCCVCCGQECRSREDLQDHIQGHGSDTKEGRMLYSCERCGRKFLSEYAANVHKREEHPTTNVVQPECRHCGKRFKSERHCLAHEKKHEDQGEVVQDSEASVRCDACAKTFSNRHNLLRHQRNEHTQKNSGRFRCPECGKDFVDSTRLKQHRWIHSGYAPYRCDGCDRGFRHVAHLRRHRAKEHGAAEEERAFKCPRCPRAFIYAYQLRTHANVVHGGIREEEEERRAEEGNEDEWVRTVFKCALCREEEASFNSYQELQVHCAEKHPGGQQQQQQLLQQQQQFPSGRGIVLEVPPGTEAAAAAAIAAAAGGSVVAPPPPQQQQLQQQQQQQFVILYEDGNMTEEK